MTPAMTFLGLAKRAGRLTIGEESVKIDARANKAKLILTACDAGRSLGERAQNFSTMAKCPHIALPWTKEELGSLVGRGTPGIMAITDKKMAEAFQMKLEKEKCQ